MEESYEAKEAIQKELDAIVDLYVRCHAFKGAISLARLGATPAAQVLIAKACPDRAKLLVELIQDGADLKLSKDVPKQDLENIASEAIKDGDHVIVFETLRILERPMTLDEAKVFRAACEANIVELAAVIAKFDNVFAEIDKLIVRLSE